MAGGRGVAVVLQAIFGLPGHCRMGIGDRAGVESGVYRPVWKDHPDSPQSKGQQELWGAQITERSLGSHARRALKERVAAGLGYM